MKMIASTKVNKAQRGMDAARAFGAASNGKNDGMDKRGCEKWHVDMVLIFFFSSLWECWD